jgi:hypothetical protein
MRPALVLLALPILVQCQSEVQALRYTTFVPLYGRMQTGSNPGHYADGLWLPEQCVICEMQVPPGTLPNPGVPWRIVAKFGEARDLEAATGLRLSSKELRLPSDLADRLVALARRGPADCDEQVALATALVEAGVVSSHPEWREIQTIEARNAQTAPSR